MIKNFKAKILIVFVLCLMINVPQCKSAGEEISDIIITVDFNKIGNIFTDKNISAKITVQNKGTDVCDVEIKTLAYTESGKREFEKNTADRIEPLSEIVIDIEFTAAEYGFHMLKIGVNSTERSCEYSTRFSVINAGGKMNDKIGLNSHYIVGKGLDKMEELQKLYSTMGIKHAREGITWAHYEGKEGVYNLYKSHKRMLGAFRDNNQTNLMLLGHENIARNIIFPRTEEERKFWDAYVENLCTDIKDYGVKDFEVWNEVDYYWASDRRNYITPEQYVKLLQVTYKTIHRIIPDAKVYAFALGDQSNIVFEEECFKYAKENDISLGDLFDGISFHPYTTLNSPESGMFLTWISAQRELMKKWNIADKSLIISEVGYTDGDGYISSEQQAAYVVRMSALARDRVDYTNWYVNLEKIDQDNEKEVHFGWMRGWRDQEIDYEAKPVLIAIANYNRFMAGVESDGNLTLKDGNGYIYKYKQNSKNVYMIWKDGGGAEINLDIGADSAEVVDIYGNSHIQKTENGVICLRIDDNPQYIVGNFSKCVEVNGRGFEISEDEVLSKSGKTAELNIKSVNGSDDYSLTAEVPEGIKIIENNGFNNGKAKIKLDITDFDAEKFIKPRVKLIVSDSGGNIVQTNTVLINSGKADVSVSGNKFIISGRVQRAGEDISISVMRPNSENLYQNPESYVYINQIKSDAQGKYSFEFNDESPSRGEYKILFRVDNDLAASIYEYDLCVPEIILTKDGKEVKKLSDVKGGELSARLSIVNMFDETLKGMLVCAQYKDGKLNDVESTSIDANSDKSVFELPIEYLGDSEVDEIKVFLWSKDSISPLVNNVTIKNSDNRTDYK